MPIRIVKDKNKSIGNNQRRPSNNRNTNNGGGGAGLVGALLPLAMNLFKKNPKVMLAVIVIGVLAYFLLGKGCSPASMLSEYSKGNKFDIAKYDATETFEPLADNVKNPIPNKVSLLQYAPRRLNQGSQGSCVGWSSSYAARTILHSRMTGKDPNKVAFSPSFLYNQIALEGCQGTYLSEAMKNLYSVGDLPFSEFKYDENSCNRKPNSGQKNAASEFKIKGFNRLTVGGDKYKVDLLAIKQNLAQGAPVVIGMMVGGTFMQSMQGKEVWRATRSDINQSGFGGHAMCVIGYDDFKIDNKYGAFQIMNSWGPEWGKNGLAWVSYQDFETFTKEAYGLYPMGNADQKNRTKLKMSFGLVENVSGKNIPFKKVNGISFRTSGKLAKGTPFKIESTNSIECYTYVFGQETDGTSYVLFPYSPKNSPYCGITGTRLFPKGESMVADNLGTRDYMAIVVTKKPIDYNELNKRISQTRGSSYAEKVSRAIQQDVIPNVSFSASGNTIDVSCDTKGKNMLAVVLEIDK